MLLPNDLLSILKTAALGGGLLLSAGCASTTSSATTLVTYPDGTQVVLLPADQPGQPSSLVVNQPAPYVPGHVAPAAPAPQNQPQPVATPAQPPPDQPVPSFHDPCPPCGMG